MTAGRLLAIVITLVVLLGAGYATLKLSRDREVHQDKEAILRSGLAEIRSAIAAHKRETGRYPAKLEALVPRHLRRIPADPFTGKPDWRIVTEETVLPNSDFTTSTAGATEVFVIDVHSAAPRYATW